MEYNKKRLHRCCFTGHRPEKLSNSEGEVKALLEKAIDNTIADGYETSRDKPILFPRLPS